MYKSWPCKLTREICLICEWVTKGLSTFWIVVSFIIFVVYFGIKPFMGRVFLLLLFYWLLRDCFLECIFSTVSRQSVCRRRYWCTVDSGATVREVENRSVLTKAKGLDTQWLFPQSARVLHLCKCSFACTFVGCLLYSFVIHFLYPPFSRKMAPFFNFECSTLN